MSTHAQPSYKSSMKEHGFDLTDFNTYQGWQYVCDVSRLSLINRDPRGAFVWGNDTGLIVVTGNNPDTGEYREFNVRPRQPGYASYIGIEGPAAEVDSFVALIHQHANFKGESIGRRGFI